MQTSKYRRSCSSKECNRCVLFLKSPTLLIFYNRAYIALFLLFNRRDYQSYIRRHYQTVSPSVAVVGGESATFSKRPEYIKLWALIIGYNQFAQPIFMEPQGKRKVRIYIKKKTFFDD